jgi:hypothetical protein
MLAETLNGIQIEVTEAVVLQAVEEFLNTHLFKEPLKVMHLSSLQNVYNHAHDLSPVYKITCASELARLAGETVQ